MATPSGLSSSLAKHSSSAHPSATVTAAKQTIDRFSNLQTLPSEGTAVEAKTPKTLSRYAPISALQKTSVAQPAEVVDRLTKSEIYNRHAQAITHTSAYQEAQSKAKAAAEVRAAKTQELLNEQLASGTSDESPATEETFMIAFGATPKAVGSSTIDSSYDPNTTEFGNWGF